MCEPTTLAMMSLAIGAGSAVMGHQQAAGQAKVQSQIHAMNQKAALQDMQMQYADSGIRQQQEAQASAEQAQERRRVALIEAASVNAAVGESGAAGITMGALMREVLGSAGRDVSTINTNRDWVAGQLERDRQGIRSQGISRMNSTSRGVGPSGAATALQIGSAGLDSYSYYKSVK